MILDEAYVNVFHFYVKNNHALYLTISPKDHKDEIIFVHNLVA